MTFFTSFLANNVPQQITGIKLDDGFFNGAIFVGVSGFNSNGRPIYNSGSFFMGSISGQSPIQVATGINHVWNINGNHRMNVGSLWFEGNVTDGVYIITY